MYNIIGTYHGVFETLEWDIPTRDEAIALVIEYQMAFGAPWSIFFEKV